MTWLIRQRRNKSGLFCVKRNFWEHLCYWVLLRTSTLSISMDLFPHPQNRARICWVQITRQVLGYLTTKKFDLTPISVMANLTCQLCWATEPVIQSNTTEVFLWRGSIDTVKIYNQLTLSKGDYPGQCGWVSPNQMESFKNKTEGERFCLKTSTSASVWLLSLPSHSDSPAPTTVWGSYLKWASPSPLSLIYSVLILWNF
jgi:hypothetical protein